MEQVYKKVLLEKILYPYGARHVEDEFALLLCTDETGKSVKFKMLSGTVRTGDEYHVTYHTENDSRYGETNVIDSILEYDDLDSTVGIRKFISKITSGDIAKRISDKYGMKIIEVLNKEPDEAKKELKTVKGIRSARTQIIIDKYNEKKSLLAATLALGKYGFTEPQLKLIKNFYKDITKAVCAIQKNIYALTYIDGIKFHDIDKKALDLNYTCNDGRRMIAGLRYCFIQALDRYGWSYMREKQIYAMVNECKIPNFSPYVKSAINYMVEHKCINITGAQKVYSLSKLYNVEADIMRELYRIAAGNIERISDSVLQEHLDNLTTYNEDQLDFVKKAANSALSVVTGAAGTGKTYSVQGVVSLFKHEVCYGCALSGRAAANLKESLGKVECSTIHRAIPELMGNFGANNENFDNAKVIIVDESTMIDGEIFLTLLKHVKTGTRLILMGDIKQLPPIGKCQIFHDILLSEQFTYSNLTKPCRQDADSGILAYSFKVVEGDIEGRYKILDNFSDISEADYGLDAIENYFFAELENYNSLREVQICMAMRAECAVVNERIHNKLKEKGILKEAELKLKKKSGDELKIQVGDKLINTKNIYKDLYDQNGNNATCMNGEIGIVKKIEFGIVTIAFIQNDQIVDINFEKSQLENMEYGYACTCHKLQGSGFSSVIVGMGNSFCGMYTREWFYTAVTRAKKNVKIFTTDTALKHAFYNCETNKKQTFLEAMLNKDERLVG